MSSTGAGRFAVGARFAWVEEFLKGTGSLSSQIAANTATKPYYTKNEIFTALNITQFPQKVWSMNQYNYQDNITDYAERTLIYNTMSFQIAEDAKFYVNPSNGSRYIDNFAVLPTTTVQENFDFNSIDGFTSIANIPLKTYLDPSGIGRTVNINFVGDTARTNHYDLQSLAVDKSKIASWSGLNPVTLAADGNQLLDQLFNDGITKFLTSDNKPILYGTVGADTIAASDIGSISHPYLDLYKVNGVALLGGAGNDTLLGGGFADILQGGAGNDTLDGGAGNDTIYAGDATDTVNGGSDLDILSYEFSSASVNVMIGNLGINIMSIEGVFGSNFADAVVGDAQNNLIVGLGDNDTLKGDVGNDTLVGGAGNDTLDGGAGNDVLYGFWWNGLGTAPANPTPGNDVLNGGDGDDNIQTGEGKDTLIGGAGNDTLIASDADTTNVITYDAGAGSDIIWGGGTGELLIGNNDVDVDYLHGRSGNDTLIGGVGDVLDGGAGDDTLVITEDNTIVYNSSGNDTYVVTPGAHVYFYSNGMSWAGKTLYIGDQKIQGPFNMVEIQRAIEGSSNTMGMIYNNIGADYNGLGVNTVQPYGYQSNESDVVRKQFYPANRPMAYLLTHETNGTFIEIDGMNDYPMSTNIHSLSVDFPTFGLTSTGQFGSGKINTPGVYTVPGTSIGTSGNDSQVGSASDDAMMGLDGNDTLSGGAGADMLTGGAGKDVMTGGAGDDVFAFHALSESVHTGSMYDRIVDFNVAEDKIALAELGFTSLTTNTTTQVSEMRMSYSASSDRTYVRNDQNDFEFYLSGDYRATLTNANFDFPIAEVAPPPPPVGQTIVGTAGVDSLTGGAGGDVISGLAGNDKLFGLDGADTLDGGAGIDQMTGGLGADIFRFTSLTHSVHTGSAYDRIVDFDEAVDKIDLRGLGFNSLTANGTTVAGELRMSYSATSDRTYVRNNQNDFEFYLDGDYRTTLTNSHFIFNYVSVTGTSGVDTVTGTAETELLFGLGGNDTLLGNGGDDTLDGGAGADVLTGGDGTDVFKFLSLTDSLETTGNLDKITDFWEGTDKIDLSGLGFMGLDTDGGNTEAGELRLAYSATSNRTYVRTDQSTFEFYLDGNHSATLTQDDFIF